ncbi:MAG: AmmeMemoRadiSam system protein A [Clostridia bacterium]|nr:AmmeMemoRadiSam system protein A [Clostridia bacterium]
MGKILGAYLMPHPPVIIPDVGKGQEQKIEKTIKALNKMGEDIAEKKPHTIILISPHGAFFKDAISIMGISTLKGDLSRFGAKNVKIEKENNLDFVKELDGEAWEQGVPTVLLDEERIRDYKLNTDLDHGAVVPLYFVEKVYKPYQLVHINYGMIPREEQYHFGKIIAESLAFTSNDAVIIASGDLSHKLTPDAPAGYHPSGQQFDKTIIKLIQEGDVEGIFSLEDSIVTEAGECGLSSIDIMLGAFDGWRISTDVLSYEGPFGVGYGTAIIQPVEKDQNRLFLDCLKKKSDEKILLIREREDPLVRLARRALEAYVNEQITIDLPSYTQEDLKTKKAGVFVSIKKDGQLRGCIGTTQPVENNIGKEIIRNSIHSGTQDPRFYPVDRDELEQLVYSVDVLGEPEEIFSKEELDVKKYGVIVEKGFRKGLLLPNLEGVETIEDQLNIALKKANITKDEKYKMYRFKVERHK